MGKGEEMNGQKIQEHFRWITPVTLVLLSALLTLYLFMLKGWASETKEIKACLSGFETEVRETYVPRKEIEGYFGFIKDSLTKIEQRLPR